MKLESAESLAQHQAARLIIDCRFSLADPGLGEQRYHQGHIPGALYAHLDKHLSSEITAETGRHPLPDFDALIAQLGQWGVDRYSRVVVYDDASGMFACRLWWLLRTLGHSNVAVLDGGIQAWQSAGLSLQAKLPVVTPTRFVPRLNRDAWRDVEQVQHDLAAGACVLIDARARERYNGVSEPIDPIAGHIPGSVNMPVTENLDKCGYFLPPEQLRDNYLAVMGGAGPEKVIHTCGSGVFACFGVLAMEVAGLKGSKLYPGSWSEWIRDPARGVATK